MNDGLHFPVTYDILDRHLWQMPATVYDFHLLDMLYLGYLALRPAGARHEEGYR